MSKTFKKSLILILVFLLMLPLLSCNLNVAYAIDREDGKYVTTFNDKIGMGIKAFENEERSLILEKIGDNYYLTVSLRSDKISDFTLHLSNDKVGETITYDGNIERHTYTLSKNNVFSTLHFSMYIKRMGQVQEFTITPVDSDLSKIGEVDKTIERPAMFIPSFLTTAVSGEQEVGSKYTIAPATAKMGLDNLEVSVSAYYLNNGIITNIPIENNQISLDLIGEYHVKYRTETDKYKTNLGNNSYNEIDIKIISKNNAKNIVKVKDIQGKDVLPDKVNVVAGYVDKTRDIYKISSKAMKQVADKYEVLSVNIFDDRNNIINPGGSFEIYFDVSDKFNKEDVKIYYVSYSGELTYLGGEIEDNYVKVVTDKVGIFVACVPGVAFIMPTWGYALIGVFSAIILIVIIVVPIVVTKKKKAIKEGKVKEPKKKKNIKK